jgi:ribonuclease P protein component
VLKFGFGKSLHIIHNEHIRQVCRKGKKLGSAFAAVFFYPNDVAHPRLGVSIGKKQVAKAVSRNQIKRITRESFRLNQHMLPAMDIVLIFYKPVLTQDKKQLRSFIDQQWQRLKVSSKNVPSN